MSTTFSTQNLKNISTASDVLGHKWSAEILHALSQSPMGFCQLQRAIGGVNPRTLSARLDSLEKQDIIKKQVIENCANDLYELEEKGEDLLPAIKAMTSWGNKYSS